MLKKIIFILLLLSWFSCSKESNGDSKSSAKLKEVASISASSNAPSNNISLPYKHYAAQLSQSGTSNPTANILYNDIGVNITWTRNSTGFYIGTPSSNWSHGTTIVTMQNIGVQYSVGCYVTTTPVNAENIYLFTGLITTASTSDNVLDRSFVEVRVYP